MTTIIMNIFIKDDAIDKVIRELKTSGLYENSVILITTDNGGGNYFGARLTQLKVIICKISIIATSVAFAKTLFS